uniref:DUF834 domain-containing protein n=2 Tax=Oryza sativa subsp. japonica TaxID=39947 RepID=Q10IX2_ORYSJ|nr:hypothetical protein [Oryza sativa Japonica Group]ABF96866.1 hypothetical protein LOC_Os03g32780 [Oryza sativa Japonica Group]
MTDSGGVRMEGRRCRGRRRWLAAAMPEVVVARPTAHGHGGRGCRRNSSETEGEAPRATVFRQNRWQAGVEGDAPTPREDGDDDSRCTGEAAQAAGGGGVVATPLVVGEDVAPIISPRNGGDAREEEAAARPLGATARPAHT